MIIEWLNERDQSVLRWYPHLCPGAMICNALNDYWIRPGHRSLPQNNEQLIAMRKSVKCACFLLLTFAGRHRGSSEGPSWHSERAHDARKGVACLAVFARLCDQHIKIPGVYCPILCIALVSRTLLPFPWSHDPILHGHDISNIES